ncbi:trimeric intracellular cation channel family protein [Lipingzhangella sp. LS1_29]|uniref:Trimeric intracellular cation channel family protein n=1 Tax=Lipingzhangella rawalii TaxID=2055835 RepID=A0ABU2H4C1_9ACTN|nr:trimeric intracellular cation channel family protein [Lipingzhangella rawalii]MDS1270145.1 trimeric intracellular cation channel family protein [Lipingzhangella rawalii]
MDLSQASQVAYDVLELVGTAAFAASGALLAVRRGYDVVGITVLACATGFGGGMARDVLLGDVPPVAFTDLRYLAVAVATAAVIVVWHPPPVLTRYPLNFADAIGLGLFCVTGAVKAWQFGLGPVPATLLGLTTAIGGGMIRDILGGRSPSVLRDDEEIYAVPALLGAATTAVLLYLDLFTVVTGTLAALGAIGLRLLALRFRWRAPRARGRPSAE